jgi:hypothetical protein
MMMSFEQTPLPTLPFDNCTPLPPKRGRRTSAALNRRVRANLNILSVPDINEVGSAPLQLQPQKRAILGSSYEKLLLGGALRKAQMKAKSSNHMRTPTPRTVVSAPAIKANSMKTGGTSLMSLRMAAMLKGSADANNAQLMFGAAKSFQAPGRARSGGYIHRSPARAIPVRNRSFNAVSA